MSDRNKIGTINRISNLSCRLLAAFNFTLFFTSSILPVWSDGFCQFASVVMLIFVAYVRKVLMSKLVNVMPNCMKG